MKLNTYFGREIKQEGTDEVSLTIYMAGNLGIVGQTEKEFDTGEITEGIKVNNCGVRFCLLRSD